MQEEEEEEDLQKEVNGEVKKDSQQQRMERLEKE